MNTAVKMAAMTGPLSDLTVVDLTTTLPARNHGPVHHAWPHRVSVYLTDGRLRRNRSGRAGLPSEPVGLALLGERLGSLDEVRGTDHLGDR